MSFLKKIKEDLPNYWELEADNPKIKSLYKYILESNEAELILELKETISQDSESGIDSIYYAFDELEKCDKFGNLIFKEFERAFESAKISKDPDDVLFSITSLGPFEFEDKNNESRIIRYLEKYLTDKHPVFRHNTLFILDDWIDKDNASKYWDTIHEIKKCLKDKNWKIRYLAYNFFKNRHSIPKGYKISFFDKLRFKHGKPYSI